MGPVLRRLAGGIFGARGDAPGEESADEADIMEACEGERDRVLILMDSTSSELRSDKAESDAGVSPSILIEVNAFLLKHEYCK